mmetsp:Transcript_47239/g.147686  ORF Transcript_47239/g.147686 Transcript_47239/m.147686 type:complete len:241 (-) Transcript_47239:223-945(-)
MLAAIAGAVGALDRRERAGPPRLELVRRGRPHGGLVVQGWAAVPQVKVVVPLEGGAGAGEAGGRQGGEEEPLLALPEGEDQLALWRRDDALPVEAHAVLRRVARPVCIDERHVRLEGPHTHDRPVHEGVGLEVGGGGDDERGAGQREAAHSLREFDVVADEEGAAHSANQLEDWAEPLPGRERGLLRRPKQVRLAVERGEPPVLVHRQRRVVQLPIGRALEEAEDNGKVVRAGDRRNAID